MNIRAAEFAVVFLPEKNEANLVLGLKHLGVHSEKKKGWDWTAEFHQMVMRECFSPLVHKCQIQFSIPTRPNDNHLQKRRCLRTLTLNWVYFRVVGAGYQGPLDHWQDAQRLDSLTANDWGLRGGMLCKTRWKLIPCEVWRFFETYFSFTSNLFLNVRYGDWYTCKSLANEQLKASCKKYQTTNHLGPTSNMASNCDILSTWVA